MTEDLSRFRDAGGLVLARGTIDELAVQRLPTSPSNYEIWIAHRAGVSPELSREIEGRLLRGEVFTDEVNEELFDRYFAKTRLSAQMIEASAGIARELADVVSSLRGAGVQAERYAGELQSASQRMEVGVAPSDFSTIVARLAATTREMADYNRQLEGKMEVYSRQVETLQSTLQNVRVEALTDGLTGLANRKHFDEILRSRIADEQVNKAGLCLLLCDIDHFKRVNDTWGHQVGDQVIRYVAGVLRHNAGSDALAARYGGEEFAVLMPRTMLTTAETVAKNICRDVRAKKLSRKSTGQVLGSVTISIGVSSYRNAEGMGSFVGRADACLYHSKRTGRDRVTTDSEEESAFAA